MPTICSFFGIDIFMFVNDHNPPHFHAKYQNHSAQFNLDGSLKEGYMPPKQAKLIMAWADIYQDELLQNWELAKLDKQPIKIDPLKK